VKIFFDILVIVLTVLIIEGITLIGRYVLKVKSREIIKGEMRELHWKYMIHIHHIFIGFALIIVSYFLELWFWFNVGIGVVFSDVLHHFVILQLLENKSEFKIVEEIKKRKN